MLIWDIYVLCMFCNELINKQMFARQSSFKTDQWLPMLAVDGLNRPRFINFAVHDAVALVRCCAVAVVCKQTTMTQTLHEAHNERFKNRNKIKYKNKNKFTISSPGNLVWPRAFSQKHHLIDILNIKKPIGLKKRIYWLNGTKEDK